MSSLALQLFVNLNKLIQPHACDGLGSHYAKRLVDRVRSEHPQLLACNDPSNAHTAALSAFALGIGLRELRQEGADAAIVGGIALILKTALDRADDGLDQLAPEEVHLLLHAHEEYKTHMGARTEAPAASSRMGRIRGAVDSLPLATTNDTAKAAASWKDPDSTQPPPLHAPAIDVDQPVALPEIPQALTGDVSFATQSTFGHVPDMLSAASNFDEAPIQDPPPASEPGEASAVITPLPALAPQVFVGAMPTMHPVRQDRNAEREFSDPAQLTPESVESMLARKRMQETFQRQSIPIHAAWDGPAQVRNPQRAPVRGSALEDSDWSQPSQNASTYLHSESAPDSSLISMGKKKKTAVPLVVWTAPALLLFPPAALFYSGALWNRREYGQSLFALSLSIAGAVALGVAWMRF